MPSDKMKIGISLEAVECTFVTLPHHVNGAQDVDHTQSVLHLIEDLAAVLARDVVQRKLGRDITLLSTIQRNQINAEYFSQQFQNLEKYSMELFNSKRERGLFSHQMRTYMEGECHNNSSLANPDFMRDFSNFVLETIRTIMHKQNKQNLVITDENEVPCLNK
jgi:hypothetical protein